MDPEEYSPEDIKTFRHRAKYEDGLLNARTNIVLVFNGLMAAAANLGFKSKAGVVLAFVTLIINLFWLPCAHHHGKFMNHLGKIMVKSSHKPIDEKVRFDLLGKRFVTPTTFMCWILPWLLAMGWIVMDCLETIFFPNK
jgi:hypothetical protein